MVKNIAAYTAPGSNYPEFISINKHEKGVSFNVRGPVRMHDVRVAAGEQVEIIMTDEQFTKFLTDAVSNFKPCVQDPNQAKFNL